MRHKNFREFLKLDIGRENLEQIRDDGPGAAVRGLNYTDETSEIYREFADEILGIIRHATSENAIAFIARECRIEDVGQIENFAVRWACAFEAESILDEMAEDDERELSEEINDELAPLDG